MRFGSKPLNAARSIRKQFADAACQGLHRKRLDENVHAWGKKPEPDGPVSQSRGGLLGQKAAKRLLSGGYLGMGDRTDRTVASFYGMAKWNRKKSIRAGWRQRY